MPWPVSAAQSTSFLRSLNSPTPKLVSLRRENTGMAVPAPRQGLVSNSGMKSLISKELPFVGTSEKRWFGPDSQVFGTPDFASRITNLYSKGAFTSRVTVHIGAEQHDRGTNFVHSPKRLPLPVMAKTSSLRIRAHGTVNVTLPERFAEYCFLLNITSVKALVQNGESSGRSCQRSRISRAPVAEHVEAPAPSMVGEPCRTTGSGTEWCPHSRRTHCPPR